MLYERGLISDPKSKAKSVVLTEDGLAEAANAFETLLATLTESDWDQTAILNDNVVNEIKKLRQSDGPELQVHGSGNLIQTLLRNDLVDELWLKIFPITLGAGKRLFVDGAIPAAFTLEDCSHSPSGVIFANFMRDGDVKTGSF